MTDMPKVADLINDLRDSVTSETNKLIVANLALQTTRVVSLAAVDPDQAAMEMQHIRSATANLGAAEASVVQAKILDFVGAVVRSALLP